MEGFLALVPPVGLRCRLEIIRNIEVSTMTKLMSFSGARSVEIFVSSNFTLVSVLMMFLTTL